MTKAIYPGTFDPPTRGHLNVIQRAAAIFHPLIIAVGQNDQKPDPLFSKEERVAMVRQIISSLPNVEVISYDGLLIDLAKRVEARIIVRAFRNTSDIEFETQQGWMNRQLSGIETVYLAADDPYRMISSSLIRQLASQGCRLNLFIPDEIEELAFRRLNQHPAGGSEAGV